METTKKLNKSRLSWHYKVKKKKKINKKNSLLVTLPSDNSAKSGHPTPITPPPPTYMHTYTHLE